MHFEWATRLSSKARRVGRDARPHARAVAVMALVGLFVAGCQYGYSRNALEADANLAPPARGDASVGYQSAWMSPGYLSFSYTYGYPSYNPYSPYWYPYAAYYDPWYYPPRYAYPWYHVPRVVVPQHPRRRFRSDSQSSAPAPSPPAPASQSRRRFNLP